MVTRAAQQRGQKELDNHSRIAKRAAEQERQLQADRAMIATYKKAWKEDKGVLHAFHRYHNCHGSQQLRYSDIFATEQAICCHAGMYGVCCGG